MLQTLLSHIASLWPGYETQIVRDYRGAFRDRSGVMRDLAAFCKVNENVRSEDLERIEGRREVFRHITAMQGLDPELVRQFLEGEIEL